MTLVELQQSMFSPTKPSDLSKQQISLWHLRREELDLAHDLIQDFGDPLSCRIHAFIHKTEGDDWNARYWYSRGNSSVITMSYLEEWQYLLEQSI